MKPTLRFSVLPLAVLFAVAAAWAGDTQTTLYSFQGIHTGKADGAQPSGGLIADAAGNLYGTAYYGGAKCTLSTTKGCGTVFELSNSGGTWTETILYTFTGGADGAFPNSNLIFDASGNLYGEAFRGGNASCNDGCGVIFELSPNSSGGWTETSAYSFTDTTDGLNPIGGLTFDASGNLYGTTVFGGTGACGIGCGIIFELSPVSGGGWSKTTVYNFSNGTGGFYPVGGVIFDSAGNIYGTLSQGGSLNVNGGCSNGGCGTVFRLTKISGGWRFGLLYTFQGPKGIQPNASLVMDAAGNLYSTTNYGGSSASAGVAFELSPTTQGQWKLTLLHAFTDTTDGHEPQGLVMDASGNLYGTSSGVAYRLSPSGSGGWEFEILTALSGGDSFNAPLLRNSAGDFYGVSYNGGATANGAVYELTPVTASYSR